MTEDGFRHRLGLPREPVCMALDALQCSLPKAGRLQFWPTPIWTSARSIPRKTTEIAKASTHMSPTKSYKASAIASDRRGTDSGRVPNSPSMVFSGFQMLHYAASSNTLRLISLNDGERCRAFLVPLAGAQIVGGWSRLERGSVCSCIAIERRHCCRYGL